MIIVAGKYEKVLWIDDGGLINWRTVESMEPLLIHICTFTEMVRVMENGGPNPHGNDFIAHSRQILLMHDIYFGDSYA